LKLFSFPEIYMAEKRKFQLDEIIGAILLAVMALITFINVINRYFFSASLAFSEEITVSLFVWITLIGIAIAFRRGTNLQMTNLYDRFPPKLKRVSILVSGIIGLIVFLFLTYNSCREIYKNMTFYNTTSEALGIPTWIYSLGTPVFSLFILKEIVASTLRGIKANSDSDSKDVAAKEGGK
jgi:TRAP-type C4-dicarboxylate transport system permease small subunit